MAIAENYREIIENMSQTNLKHFQKGILFVGYFGQGKQINVCV